MLLLLQNLNWFEMFCYKRQFNQNDSRQSLNKINFQTKYSFFLKIIVIQVTKNPLDILKGC